MTTPKLPAVIDLSPFGPATLDADGVYRADMGGPSVTVRYEPGDFSVTGLGDLRASKEARGMEPVYVHLTAAHWDLLQERPPRLGATGGLVIVDEPPGLPWTPKGEGRKQRRKRERQARSKTTTRSPP